MKIIVLFAAVEALLRCATAQAAIGAKLFPASAVRSISVQTEGGAIALEVSADNTVSADVSPSAAPGDACAITRDLRAGTLTLSALTASNTASTGGNSCSAGFTASAPSGVRIIVRSVSGNVELGAFSGRIDVQTDSGAITLHGASGDLTLRSSSGSVTGTVGGQQGVEVETGSGNIYLRGLTGSAEARSRSGIVALAWAGAPRIGDVDVRTDSGDFQATLPGDARLKFSLQSGSGKMRSDFISDASATLYLSFRSGSGYATIRKNGPAGGMKEDIAPTEVFDRADLRW